MDIQCMDLISWFSQIFSLTDHLKKTGSDLIPSCTNYSSLWDSLYTLNIHCWRWLMNSSIVIGSETAIPSLVHPHRLNSGNPYTSGCAILHPIIQCFISFGWSIMSFVSFCKSYLFHISTEWFYNMVCAPANKWHTLNRSDPARKAQIISLHHSDLPDHQHLWAGSFPVWSALSFGSNFKLGLIFPDGT